MEFRSATLERLYVVRPACKSKCGADEDNSQEIEDFL